MNRPRFARGVSTTKWMWLLIRQNRYRRTANRSTLSPSVCNNRCRSASSRKITRRSLPRAVTWYTAPSYSIRRGLAITLW